MTADPIGLEGGDENLYRYAENSPINYEDHLGLLPEWKKRMSRYRGGNWCGAGWAGGKRVPDGIEPDWEVEAKDSIDACCKKHDRCYWEHGLSADDIDSCERIKCDQIFVGCLKSLPANPSNWTKPPIVNPPKAFKSTINGAPRIR